MRWSSDLNPGSVTYKIATSGKRHVRVVAGPGTGKSFAMRRRVTRLLESGTAPNKILAVTFTRVAAEDLHRELVGMNVPGCNELKGTTLHRIALQMLVRNHVLQATGRVPRPLNEFELEPLISDLAASHGGKAKVKEKRLEFEAAWASLQHEQPGHASGPEDRAFEASLAAWLRFHQAMLIGEVGPQLYDYLVSNPLAGERHEYSHILVDEYQDLNRVEQEIIELLSDQADVCVVGDDDQSIYSFKHAHPEGIRDWTTKHAGADDLGLDECRRCPTQIVRLANSLIANNTTRMTSRALAEMPSNGNGVVRITQYQSIEDEVRGVADFVLAQQKNGTPLGDILVLAQGRLFGDRLYRALTDRNVPTRSYYAESELNAVDNRRGLALLKLFSNRDDRVALRWLIGVGSTTWNAAGYRRIREYAEAGGVSPWETMELLQCGALQLPRTSSIASAFASVQRELLLLEKMPDLGAVIDHVFPDGSETSRDIRELALSVLSETEMDDPRALAKELTTAVSQPEIPGVIEEVRIMSLHKSKGLSVPVTVIAGCVEGLLPRRPKTGLTPQEESRHLEEQRRLFYVGITRVKADPSRGKPGTLLLTYSRQMPYGEARKSGIVPARIRDGKAMLNASRFVQELGPTAPRPIAR